MRLLSKNVGPTDKTIRTIAGFILAGIALYLYGRSMPWAIGLGLVAAVLLVTAFASTCPIYLPFGISTRRLRKRL